MRLISMSKKTNPTQLEIFQVAALEAGADMSKEEFGRVVGKIAKPGPKVPSSGSDKDKAVQE